MVDTPWDYQYLCGALGCCNERYTNDDREKVLIAGRSNVYYGTSRN